MSNVTGENIKQKMGGSDDYSLEPVPESERRSWLQVAYSLAGNATALIYLQFGALMAMTYGVANAVGALLYATIVGSIFGYALSVAAAKSGMVTNLLARSSGFGYKGVAIYSLAVGGTSTMYFALEGNIMAHSVHSYLPQVPLAVIIIAMVIGMIVLNWYGIKILEKFQKWSILVYVALLIIAIVISVNMFTNNSSNWVQYMPESMPLTLVGLLSCIGIINGIVGILVLNVADFGRFIKKEEVKFGSFILGVAVQVWWYLIAGLIGIWFGINYSQMDPGIYFVSILGIWGILFVILTQLRINVNNLYIGSLSISNFFAVVFSIRPGRVFWIVMMGAFATIIMVSGIAGYLEIITNVIGIFMMPIMILILTDIYIVKRLLKLGPTELEYRQNHIRDWNPLGILTITIAGTVSLLMAYGVFGVFWVPVSSLVSGALTLIIYVTLNVLTKGRFNYPKVSNEKVQAQNLQNNVGRQIQ